VPAPRRQRQRSLKTILRQARAAGAARVEYGGAMIHLTDSGSPAAPAESNGNELDQWMAKHAR